MSRLDPGVRTTPAGPGISLGGKECPGAAKDTGLALGRGGFSPLSVARMSGLRGLQTPRDSRGFWRQGCSPLHGILLGAGQTVGQVLIMSFKMNNFW